MATLRIVEDFDVLDYQWTHLISGHMGRLGSRDDVALHQQSVGDTVDNLRLLSTTFDPTEYYQKYWPNTWASVSEHLDEVARRARAPLGAKYAGRIAADDIDSFVVSTAVWILESLRLDLGLGIQVDPRRTVPAKRRLLSDPMAGWQVVPVVAALGDYGSTNQWHSSLNQIGTILCDRYFHLRIRHHVLTVSSRPTPTRLATT